MGRLGFFLTGSFGLLCGLCGVGGQTTTTHQSMWVCKKCGNQFFPRNDLVSKLTGVILGIGGPISIFGLIAAIGMAATGDGGIQIYCFSKSDLWLKERGNLEKKELHRGFRKIDEANRTAQNYPPSYTNGFTH